MSVLVMLLDVTGNHWDALFGDGSVTPNRSYPLVSDGFVVLDAGRVLGLYRSSTFTGQLHISGHDFEL